MKNNYDISNTTVATNSDGQAIEMPARCQFRGTALEPVIVAMNETSRLGYLTVRQVAQRWQVSERHVWRCIHDGLLRSIMPGGKCRRIFKEDVEAQEICVKKAS
ncbi:MAG: excisionase family DNA-binding protein [Kiritimatiellae bacterium]|nr:excisionase family DNA-binding protein [Kiritimatiellia bacterium]MDD5519456.1 excisionase family DNA-binding protein [Kiritimatiellia bacterium]